jgi:hypothetical protein
VKQIEADVNKLAYCDRSLEPVQEMDEATEMLKVHGGAAAALQRAQFKSVVGAAS